MIGPRAVPAGRSRYDGSSRAEVAEQADATVSNTVEGNLVRVQVPASAPHLAVYWQLELLNEHAADEDGLPTTIRFVFYELEQRGSAQKPKPDDVRRNVRRSKVWPPGSQDITDAITALREDGVVPWNWIAAHRAPSGGLEPRAHGRRVHA